MALEGQFRYGLVLILVLTLVFFQIAAPATSLALAVDVLLAAGALTISVATSRARENVRRRRALVVTGVGVLIFLITLTGAASATVTFVFVTLIVAAIPVTLIGGLTRLIKQRGVTAQVVAGAVAIYLVVGLLFASVIATASRVENGAYFKQGNENDAVDVYYSFTVLTTTGFGDYTAAHQFGHALAVMEMLTGQLYLVTVIGIVVGNFAGRRMGRDEPDQTSEQDLEAT
jgi:hypothetical protein